MRRKHTVDLDLNAAWHTQPHLASAPYSCHFRISNTGTVQGRIAYDHFSNIYENYSKTYVYGSSTVADWLNGEPQLGKAFTGGSESDLGASISTNSFTRRFHADASADYQNTFGAHSIYSQLKYDYEFSDEFAINSTLYRQNISWW